MTPRADAVSPCRRWKHAALGLRLGALALALVLGCSSNRVAMPGSGVTQAAAGSAGIAVLQTAGAGGMGSMLTGGAGAGSGAAGRTADAGKQAQPTPDAGAARADGGPARDSGVVHVCGNSTDPYAAMPVCNDLVGGFMQTCVMPCAQPGAPACDTGRCAPNDPYADARGCAPMLCDTTMTTSCGPVSDCTPTSSNRDAYGCVRKACSKNEDCPCGACVMGGCYEWPFHCFVEMFAP